MKKLLIAVAVLALGLPAFAETPVKFRMDVVFGDLDLDTPAGMKTLVKRFTTSLRMACYPMDDHAQAPHLTAEGYRACIGQLNIESRTTPKVAEAFAEARNNVLKVLR